MKRNGFIHREKCRKDRRATLIFLTDKGRNTKDIIINVADKLNEISLSGLTQDQKTNLNQLLTHMQENLQS